MERYPPKIKMELISFFFPFKYLSLHSWLGNLLAAETKKCGFYGANRMNKTKTIELKKEIILSAVKNSAVKRSNPK